MAKTLARLKQLREHMVINPNTTGNSEHIAEYMLESGWTGEIFVQPKDNDASLWTLADDIETAIEFISKNEVEKLADVQISGLTPSSSNVKEEYALINHDGEVLGETIKIYNDTALFGVYLGHVDDVLSDPTDPESIVPGTGDTALCFIYYIMDGTYQLTTINIEEFLEESEFADGLEVNNHIVSVKIDENSEPVITEYSESGVTEEDVITVGPDGIKVAHIQDAIDAAVENMNSFTAITDGNNTIEADAPGTTVTINGSDTVNVEIDENEKSITLTSPEVGISGDTYISAEADNHNIVITTNVVDDAEDFRTEDVDGKLVDAGVVKKVIVDNEKVVSAALNELRSRINEVATPQDIRTSEELGEGLADAYDVKGFALYDIDTTDSATTSGVQVQVIDGFKKLDFSRLVIDCGTF